MRAFGTLLAADRAMWTALAIPTLTLALTLLAGPMADRAVTSNPSDDPRAATPAAATASVTERAETPDPARVASDTEHAERVLAELSSRYRLLDGITVRVGKTPGDFEAVAYYAKDEIVVSDSHHVPIDKILAHEIWHIIDWRDNGRLDWGEDLPPATAPDYEIQ